MIRALASRLNRTLSERFSPPRRRFAAPVKVWFEPEKDSETAIERARSQYLAGESVDVSRSGIAFLVPAIRIKEKYFVGHNRIVNIEMELPTGNIYFKVLGRRYERVGSDIAAERYFIGAEIVNISDEDREKLLAVLKHGDRGLARAAGRLQLGIDQ